MNARLLKRLPLLSLWVVSLGLDGCANSMSRGPWEQLAVESDPPGAQVHLSNGVTGTTPVRFGIRRNGDLKVTVSKDGFETVVVSVDSKIDKLGALSAIPTVIHPAGILVGVADLATGSGSSHRPNPVRVKLTPLRTTAKASEK